MQCTKKEKTEELPMVPKTPEELILGKWDLQYTLYKDPVDTFYYAQNGLKETYEFFNNDTVFVDSYRLGIQDTFRTAKKHYRVSNYILAIDTFPGLVINGSSSIMNLSSNTLSLDTRHKDGDYKFFTRQ